MHTEVYGTGVDLVFVLGWGNNPEHETVRWLIDRLVEAGYRVHAIEIPTTITDFDAEYRQPVARYVATLSSYRLLTHSTGGLIGAFLSGPKTRVYLRPWWGMHGDQDGLLARLFARLPIARPLFDGNRRRGHRSARLWGTTGRRSRRRLAEIPWGNQAGPGGVAAVPIR